MHILVIQLVTSQTATISGDEWRHANRSLRLGVDDILHGTPGDGNLYHCRITSASKESARLDVLGVTERQLLPGGRVILAAGNLHDTDRMEWMLEKAVELGITDFIPIITEHTVKKGTNPARFQRIAMSAAKQSKRYHFPEIHSAMPLHEMSGWLDGACIWLAWCGAPVAIRDAGLPAPNQDHIILIGPEGDFSSAELKWLEQYHPESISLGSMRLRSETAAIMALSVRSARMA